METRRAAAGRAPLAAAVRGWAKGEGGGNRGERAGWVGRGWREGKRWGRRRGPGAAETGLARVPGDPRRARVAVRRERGPARLRWARGAPGVGVSSGTPPRGWRGSSSEGQLAPSPPTPQPQPGAAIRQKRGLAGGGAEGRAAERGAGRDRGPAENPDRGRKPVGKGGPAANGVGVGKGGQDPAAGGATRGRRADCEGSGHCVRCATGGFLISPECGVRFTGSRKDGDQRRVTTGAQRPGQSPSPLPHLSKPERTGDSRSPRSEGRVPGDKSKVGLRVRTYGCFYFS